MRKLYYYKNKITVYKRGRNNIVGDFIAKYHQLSHYFVIILALCHSILSVYT